MAASAGSSAPIEARRTATKILRHLGLPHQPPKVKPARIDQHELCSTDPPADVCCEPPPADDEDQLSPHDNIA